MTGVKDTVLRASVPLLGHGSGAGGALFNIAATVVLWLGLISLPSVPSPDLDTSWQLTLHHAWVRNLAFGRDIIFTYGPWGWLNTRTYHPATFTAHVVWKLGWAALCAALIMMVAGRLSWPRRLALFAAALLALPAYADVWSMLVIGGVMLWLASTESVTARRLIAVGGLLGFLALQKFTASTMTVLGAGVVCLELSRRRDWRAIGWLAGSLTVSVAAWWLVAGQTLSLFPWFLGGSVEMAAGYTDAMFLDEPPAVFRLGLITGLTYLCVVWGWPRRQSLPVSFLLTVLGVLLWKQYFVRADAHVLGFFFAMLFAGITAPLFGDPGMPRRLTSWALCLLAVWGAVQVPRVAEVGSRLPHRLVENVRRLIALREYRHGLERDIMEAAAAIYVPAIRAHVGQARVDQFGHEQTTLLWNDLNYAPRPVPQSYAAYSGPLAARNEEYYRSTGAPDFTLAKLQTIDGRLPSLDDAVLLPRLVTDHQPVLLENGILLLRRRKEAATLALEPRASGTIAFGVEYPVPGGAGAVWVRLDVRLSWLGALRTLLYKPPSVWLAIRDEGGAVRRFRLVRAAARAGFLLSPLLLDTADLERLVTTRTGRTVRSVWLEVHPRDRRFFRRSVR